MSEKLTGEGNVEKGGPWCETYQTLKQRLAASYEAEASAHISDELIPYWDGQSISEALSELMTHRESCEPCIDHFNHLIKDRVGVVDDEPWAAWPNW